MMFLKRIVLSVIITVIASVGMNVSIAQDRSQIYRKPAELRLERAVRRNFRDYFLIRNREQLGAATFFPIGWSKDGKFAYYTEPVDEACNCYFAKLFILDLKTDKELWKFDYDSDFLETPRETSVPDSLDTLWKNKLELFSGKLREFDIIPEARFALTSFPAIRKGDVIKTSLRIVETNDEESREFGVVSKATLKLNSKRYGTKTLFEQSYPEARPLDIKVIGYVKSPYEDRIAVILIEVYRGYEGPPHTGHIKIAGATLASGY